MHLLTNPKCLLVRSRQISTPSHLSQFLSFTIISSLFNTKFLPFLNSLLVSLSQSPSPALSLPLFNSIHKQRNILFDNYTLTSTIKAVASLSLLSQGQQIHSLAVKFGLDSDTFVLNSLISMYSACGSVNLAKNVFHLADDSTIDVVSWNSMISGYLKSDFCREALVLFGQMMDKRVAVDSMTAVSALVACSRVGFVGLGRKIHSMVVVNGFELDFYRGTSLVTMYAKCGHLETARQVFDSIHKKNVVCWTAMVSGYSQSGQFKESVELFREMQHVGITPENATVACVVSCCGKLGALDQGRYLDAYCDAKGLQTDLNVKNAFIDMYSKCGDIGRALKIFDGLVNPDVFSWTSIICGLAMNGHSRKALELFSQMESAGKVMPNEVTFLGVLSACSHGGFVEKGLSYFKHMIKVYKLSPQIEHYSCMVDLLGRAKLLGEAEKFIREMPVKPDVAIWRSLLFACRACGEVKLAEIAAKRITELEPNKFGGHVLLSNVYAGVSRWTDVNQIRKSMIEQRIQKEPGCSYIELYGNVHEFLATDSSHHLTKDIHEALGGISKTMLSQPFNICIPGMCHESTEIYRISCQITEKNIITRLAF